MIQETVRQIVVVIVAVAGIIAEEFSLPAPKGLISAIVIIVGILATVAAKAAAKDSEKALNDVKQELSNVVYERNELWEKMPSYTQEHFLKLWKQQQKSHL